MKWIMLFLFAGCTAKISPTGRPWNKEIQVIPGRIESELYDEGGEGVAYHDADTVNNGSGRLNPVNGQPLNEFRLKEGVDISYTKSNGIDNNPFNKTTPVLNSLYVGWTEPGEWVNYTVKVLRSGDYNLGLMYTANGDGGISVEVDGKPATDLIKIPSTNNPQDTIAWRQWHHWSKMENIGTLALKRGVHVLTLKVREHGQMNFDYLEFADTNTNKK